MSLLPFSTKVDKILLSHYLKLMNRPRVENSLVVIKIEREVVEENKLWPWDEDWARYLVAFVIDLKPRKLILGSEFLSSISDSDFLKDFSKRENLVISNPEKNSLPPGIKIKGHLKVMESNGYYYSLLDYKNTPLLRVNSRLDMKGDKFYFLPVREFPDILSAQDIALAGFLRGEEFKGVQLNKVSGKIVLVEVAGPNLIREASLLHAQMENSFFYLVPRELSVYFGLFLFVLIYILCRKLRYRATIVILAVFGMAVILVHLGYFQAQRYYFEIMPIAVFSLSGFGSALVEREIQARREKKYKKEMQIARLLKEKEILPAANISSDGVSVSITRYKMDRIGGDFYQFLEFSRGELGVVLGWAPDEGVERVKYIMEVIHGWRDFATVYKEPGKVIQVLNNSLFRFGEQGKYATLLYMLFDARKSTLKYVNAGHDPFIILRSNGFVRVIEAQDPTPVGIARDINFKEGEVTLYPGDSVIAFSGGISKIIQEKEGIKREFLSSLKSYIEYQPQEFCNYIFNALVKTYPQKPEEEWSLLTMRVE